MNSAVNKYAQNKHKGLKLCLEKSFEDTNGIIKSRK